MRQKILRGRANRTDILMPLLLVRDRSTKDTGTAGRTPLRALILQLRLPLAEARRRASLRLLHLTEDEFDALHGLQTHDMAVDATLEVGLMSLDEQSEAVAHLWQP